MPKDTLAPGRLPGQNLRADSPVQAGHPAQGGGGEALIGPNAILQMIPVLESAGGSRLVQKVLATAGLDRLPDGQTMIPQIDAARMHQAMRACCPVWQADAIAQEAGTRTADYILACRIPKPAQRVLKMLPARWAAPILARAIAKHAWTFAGSGQFRVLSPWRFEIRDNPIVQGERAPHTLCMWHAAVFQRLYQVLVARDVTCTERVCCAQAGQDACVFILTRR